MTAIQAIFTIWLIASLFIMITLTIMCAIEAYKGKKINDKFIEEMKSKPRIDE